MNVPNESSDSVIEQALPDLKIWAQRLYDAGFADGQQVGYPQGFKDGANQVSDQVTSVLSQIGINPAEPVSEPTLEPAVDDESTLGLDALSIAELGLSARPYNALMANHILTLGTLLRTTRARLLQLDNLGTGSVTEIEAALKLKSYGQLASQD